MKPEAKQLNPGRISPAPFAAWLEAKSKKDIVKYLHVCKTLSSQEGAVLWSRWALC